MRKGTNKNKFSIYEEDSLNYQAGDSETLVRDTKHRMPPNPIKTPNSANQFERLNQASTTKNSNTRIASNPLFSLKNDLYNLKNDFSNYFNQESPRQPKHLHKRNSTQNYSLYQDDFQDSIKYYPNVTNSVQIIEQQNISLKAELKRLQLRYQTKKHQYREAVKFLNKKIEYLSEELMANEEGILQCKQELEGQMEIIREQLLKKKDAEISLEDYGILVEINSTLKQEINSYLNTIEDMKTALSAEYVKYGELQKEKNKIQDSNRLLEDKTKHQMAKRLLLQTEKQKLTTSLQTITYQLKQFERNKQAGKLFQKANSKKIQQLEETSFTLKSQVSQLENQNSGLRNRQLMYLKNIGDLNSQCMELNNTFELYKSEHINHSDDSEVNKLRQLNIKFKQEMESLLSRVKNLQEIKQQMEIQRSAMLSDIIFIQKELEKKDIEINSLNLIVSQKQHQVVILKGVIDNYENKKQETTAHKHNESIFVQSSEIAEEVTKDFENILNSPKIFTNQKNVTFNIISEVIEDMSDLNKDFIQGQIKTVIQNNPEDNALRNYIQNLHDDNHELAVSIIVSESQLFQQSSNLEEGESKQESMLISGLSNAPDSIEVLLE